MDALNYEKKKECECTMNYSEHEISGHSTECYYHGQGVWQCPECATIYDHSDIVYSVVITYILDTNEDGECIEIDIETEDARLHEAPHRDYPDSTNLKCMIDDIYDELASGDIKIKNGKYKTDILWNWYQTHTDCGMESDMEIAIVSEEKIEFDDSIELTELAIEKGFKTVDEVRTAYCKTNEKYDTCSVCSQWNRIEKCTLLKAMDGN